MANKLIPCGGYFYNDEQIQFEKTPTGQPLIKIIGDGKGVTDYSGLTGKPQINGKELTKGNNTLDTLGIQAKGNYLTQVPQATETEFGAVKKIKNISNVTAEDATAVGSTYNNQEIDKIVNVANGCKGTINAILKALKEAGIMA